MKRLLLIALLLHVVVLLLAMPATPWEFDEPLFFQALHRYDPLAHHPPPPGYPVFILFAQVVRQIMPGDFSTLVLLSVIAAAAGLVFLALALRNMTGDIIVGVAGAMLFYLSPALLVHSTLPISEPGALALLAAALYFGSRGDAVKRFAFFAALTVGWRIQFAIFVVPLFVVSVLMMKRWRDRAAAVGVFTIVCLAWLTPLTIAVGGVDELIRFETAQGEYLAEHDAAVSRSGWTPLMITFRFIAHAWGTKVTSFPILILAAIGMFVLRRKLAFLPLAVAAAVYIGFALFVMDPADGVRYSIPFALFTALMAAAGIAGVTAFAARKGGAALVVVGLLCAGFLIYTGPMLWQRRTSPSPPVAAARYARAAMPPNAVALYELPLWPHATYFLADRNPLRVDRGLTEYFDRPDVPLFIYADGATSIPGARTFRWRMSDAYQKLTRKHYGASSIIPIAPQSRFKPLTGVHAPERTQQGREWRWLDSPAEIQLPTGPSRDLTLRLGLPAEYPFGGNDVVVKVGGVEAARVGLERGKPVDVIVPLPAGSALVRLESRIAYVPAELPGSLNRDPRRLAVEMYDLRSGAAAARAVRPVASR